MALTRSYNKGLGDWCVRQNSVNIWLAIIFMLPLVVVETAPIWEIGCFIIAEVGRSQEGQVDHNWTYFPPQEHLLDSNIFNHVGLKCQVYVLWSISLL
jgi:hypothetical protein